MANVSETFLTQGHAISVEVCQHVSQPQPAILVLHGADGPNARRKSYLRLANGIAEHDYTVFLVHYFDRTGTVTADRETTRNCFLDWRKTVIDAVVFAAAHPSVLTDSVGLLGFSLGATLALSVAGRLRRIRAVAEFSGAMPDPSVFMMRMPPALIVHGGKDEVVRVEEAYKLERLLQERNIAYEIEVYPKEGHLLRADAYADAFRKTALFFDKYLRRADVSVDNSNVQSG